LLGMAAKRSVVVDIPAEVPTARRHPDRRLSYLLLTPAIVFAVCVTFPPFAYALWISLHRWQLTRPDLSHMLVGLDNYRSVLHNPDFHTALAHSVEYTVTAVAASFFLGLGLALLLSRTKHGRELYTTLLLLPMVSTPIVIGLLYRYLYNYDYGFINWLIGGIGLPRVAFLGSPGWALWSIVLVEIWEWTPFVALVLLAGLDNMPRSTGEAAAVDRASSWQIFRYITIPQMKKVIIIVILIRAMDALRSFDLTYMMTQGGPGLASETLPMQAWRQTFFFFNMGLGAAVAMIMFYLVLTVSWGLLKSAGLGSRVRTAHA
jgi:multiple sugar transport system permease protein